MSEVSGDDAGIAARYNIACPGNQSKQLFGRDQTKAEFKSVSCTNRAQSQEAIAALEEQVHHWEDLVAQVLPVA